MGRDLTAGRDAAALAFIREYHGRHGVVPTVREVGRHLGLSAPNNAVTSVERLVDAGQLERAAPGPRSYRLPAEKRGLSLPFGGLVAAGPPIETTDPGRDRLDISGHLDGTDRFVLRVRGTSMVGALIGDGDYVVLRSVSTAQSGQKVVCRYRDGLTLKVFRRRGRKVWLESCNPDAGPIEPAEHEELEMVGALVAVLRLEA